MTEQEHTAMVAKWLQEVAYKMTEVWVNETVK